MCKWILALMTFLSLTAFAAEPEVVQSAKTDAVTADTKMADTADVRKESEISLNLDASKKSASGDSTVFRILFSLTMLGVLGGGAFLFLRKYAVPKGMKTQTQIKILQQHYLGPKKSLAIVRVAGESILIGVTDSNISMIKSLSLLDDEVPEEIPNNFSKALNASEEPVKSEDGEDFSFGGIKDVVSKRLRGMRDLE